MSMVPVFDADLIRRYDRPGPRYTSYPTAMQFTETFGESDHRDAVAERDPAQPLSVYVHIPFCASPCFYCACTRIITRQREMGHAYLQRLEHEIALQAGIFGGGTIQQLHFGGGTPTFFSIDQLGCVIDSLGRHFSLTNTGAREYSIEIDPRTVSAATLADLAGFGFNRISFGVQDFDPEVQKAVNRIQSVGETLDLIQAARHCGFRSVSADLIYGLPLQTAASFGRTLDLIASVRPDRLAVYSYAHLPRLFKGQSRIHPEQLPSPEQKLALLRLTVETLTAAGYVYIGMDHFALPKDELARALHDGTLQRNFQGYSTQAGLDLVGLGLSAIGRVGDTYVQNTRRLDRYNAALDADRLPIERGRRLTGEDRLRRDVIASIMCRGLVRFGEIEARHGIRFAEHFAGELERLEPLAKDGLAECMAGEIRVTPRGRLLLRAVAMVFDAYAQSAPQVGVLHSKVV
jgi:oxygen-independent coproporphyrinogen III oxidase